MQATVIHWAPSYHLKPIPVLFTFHENLPNSDLVYKQLKIVDSFCWVIFWLIRDKNVNKLTNQLNLPNSFKNAFRDAMR